MAYHLCNSEVNTWILAWNDMLPGDQGVMFSVSLNSDAKKCRKQKVQMGSGPLLFAEISTPWI